MLRRGNRRQLAALEKVGRRLHLNIDCYFKESPFLRLNLTLEPWYIPILKYKFRFDGATLFSLKFCISTTELSDIDWAKVAIPSFLRFDEVVIAYRESEEKLIEEKREFAMKHLRPLSRALMGSTLKIWCSIDEEYELLRFRSYSTLLAHIEEEILPVCGTCRSYNFNVWFHSNIAAVMHSSANFIAEILQLKQIVRCTDISFEFDFLPAGCYLTILPVDAIANWLICAGIDDIDATCQNSEQRTLQIRTVDEVRISDVLELLECLKKAVICRFLLGRLFICR